MTRTLSAAIALGVLAGLLTTSAALGEETLQLSREEYPRADGSTSTQPLSMLVACRVTRTSFRWNSSFFDKTRTLAPSAEPYDPARRLSLGFEPAEQRAADRLAALVPEAGPGDRVKHTGTSQSYGRLAAGQVDLILVAREPTEAERAEARRHGAEIVVTPIARDAFVFLRNAKNPVASLTLDQVRGIYAGAVTDWKAVGGPEGPIVAYQRDKASGSQVEMERLVMRGRPMREGPDIAITTSMFGPFNAIRHDQRGIGYSYHYYERYMAPVPEVETLGIEGVRADPTTIASGRYPLATLVYLAHRSDLPRGSAAARVRDWLATPAGQAVVAESGYVPLRP